MVLKNLQVEFGRNYESFLYDKQFFAQQETPFSCAINAQQQILEEDLGFDIQEMQMIAFANDNGLVGISGTNMGTPLDKVGGILKELGYNVNNPDHVSIDDVKHALLEGKEVIVGIDSSELWNNASSENATHSFMSAITGDSNRTLDHAIRVHSYQPNSDTFTILDSGTGSYHIGVKSSDLEEFMTEPDSPVFASFISLDASKTELTEAVFNSILTYTPDNPNFINVYNAVHPESALEYSSSIDVGEVFSNFISDKSSFSAFNLEQINPASEAGTDLLGSLSDTTDGWDTFLEVADAASIGTDIIDGLSTLGIGIAAGWIVKKIYDNHNEPLKDNIQKLLYQIKPKAQFAKLLEWGVPVQVLQKAQKNI